jgi:hypothetical protein
MANEQWVIREDVTTQTIWDGGHTDWDEGVVNFAISPLTMWDETPGGEVWTPRKPYPATP